MELGTFDLFRREPVTSWLWYMERFDRVLACEPNPAHRAVAALETLHTERGGTFLLVTQNVDPLHERAGSRNLVKVHGSADRVRCCSGHCEYGSPSGSLPRADIELAALRADPIEENLPRCPTCSKVLRQHVLWFDELYSSHEDYQWPVVQTAAFTADLVLFVGTSFSVGVTDLFLRAAVDRGIPTFNIDPGAAAVRIGGVTVLSEAAEELLPATVTALRKLRARGSSDGASA